MITWMQHHKKYLVITIWIATIAFIGAGFVGWGAYDFNSDRSSAIAKVGERKVTVQEYQLAYSNYYNFYNNMMGGTLTQEKADKMGLEKMVIEGVINETLLLAYADEIGLRVSDYEIKNTLATDTSFQVDGLFNKEAYYRAVKDTGISPKDYENNLKKRILLTKVQNALKLTPTKSEQKMFASAMFMKDRLAVDVLTLTAQEGVVSEEDTKAYWDKNKIKYLSEKSYDLDTIKIGLSDEPIDEAKLKTYYEEKRYNYKSSEGKILSLEDAYADVVRDFRLKAAKREALESFLLFKKSQMNATGKLTIKVSNTAFPMDKFKNASASQVLKPIKTKDGYIVVRIMKINEPLPMPYAEAKPAISLELKAKKQVEALEKKAQIRVNLFNGQDIGFVSRDSVKKINGLSEAESLEFVNYVFDNNEKRSFKIIGNKAVLYRIVEQNLLSNDKIKKHASLINENIDQMKQAEISKNLITKLKTRYKIEQYYKGN